MMEIELEIPDKLAFLFEPARYKVPYGGRGGAKSWSIARVLLVLAMSKRLRILCAREFQLAIKDSVHRLLTDQIELLGYGEHFNITRSAIICTTGSEFLFAGMHTNIEKIRSMEGIDICWVEEAEAVSKDSWDVLIPTIRKEGSEIWASFNPYKATDPTYKKFVTSPPPDAVVRFVGWQDNPWLPETLRREKDHAYAIDPDAAEHVWGGKTLVMSKAQVLYGKVVVQPFELGSGWGGPYFGADWGFSQDPSTLVRCWVDTIDENVRDLYIDAEAYGVGVEIDDLPGLFSTVPGAKDHVIRADNARPETISYMVNHGYSQMVGCEKGPGSVADGVAYLRGFRKIVVDPSCKNTVTETRLWAFKRDRLTGDVLTELVKGNDHIMDAVRYALEPMMKNVVLSGPIDIGVPTRSRPWDV